MTETSGESQRHPEHASLRNINNVQKLVRRVTALNRFFTRSTNKCLPFFKVLQKVHEWNPNYDQAFKQLKEYLAHPSLLSQAELGDDLSVSPHVVSSSWSITQKDARNLSTIPAKHSRSRGQISSNGHDSLRIGSHDPMVKAILPNSPNKGTNRHPSQEGVAKARRLRVPNELANQAKRIWHRIPPPYDNERTSIGWICGRICWLSRGYPCHAYR